MTAQERKATRGLSSVRAMIVERDPQSISPHTTEALSTLDAHAAAFEAMREALREIASVEHEARKGIYRVTVPEMSQARAALALAEVVGK